MDEWDKLASQIHGRIDYEKAERDHEYWKKYARLEKEKQDDLVRLGDRPGVHDRYNKLKDLIDKEYKIVQQMDEERFQHYWNKAVLGTYKPETFDEDREYAVASASKLLKMEIDNYGKPSRATINALKKEYGDNIIEEVQIRWTEEKNQEAEKKEQERLQSKPVQTIEHVNQVQTVDIHPPVLTKEQMDKERQKKVLKKMLEISARMTQKQEQGIDGGMH